MCLWPSERTLSNVSSVFKLGKFEQRKNTPRDVHVDDYMRIPTYIITAWADWSFILLRGIFPVPKGRIDKDTMLSTPFFISRRKLKSATPSRDGCRQEIITIFNDEKLP